MAGHDWFIHGSIPAKARQDQLLNRQPGEGTAVWLGEEGAGQGRVTLNPESGLEQVAPALTGVYPQPGGIVPVLLGSDGRVTQIMPPLTVDLDAAQGVGDAGVEILRSRGLLDAHDEHLAEIGQTVAELDEHNRDVVDPFILDTDQKLTVDLPAARQRADEAMGAAVDALSAADSALYVGNMAQQLAQGMIWVDVEEPIFEVRVQGQIWIKVDGEGRMVGIYRLRDHEAEVAEWDVYTTITGLLIVPGADGVPTIIDQDGLVVGQIEADSIGTRELMAESVGAKQLIIGEVSRAHLDDVVDGVLADAEAVASRVVIEPSSITISRSVVGSAGALTALRLEATKMDFVVDGKSVAYIDSDRNLMSIGNGLFRDSVQIGEHQVRRLGQNSITVFQWVGV